MSVLKNPQRAMQPHCLWFLVLCYVMTFVLANWFEARLVQVFGIDTTGGTFLFPLTFILADVITEVYGYQEARRAIWMGFFFNAVYLLYGHAIVNLPSPEFATQNHHFDAVMTINLRIIIASAISYCCAEPLNTFLLAKMKIYWQGRRMALRFIAAIAVATSFDTVLFTTLAFYGEMTEKELIWLIVVMGLLKIGLAAGVLPASTQLARWLKTKEQIDRYDTHTKFQLFCLRVHYTDIDNQYSNKS